MQQLVKGEDKSFEITMRTIRSDGSVGDPLNLTGKTVTIEYRDTLGVIQTISAIIASAVLGKIEVPFTDEQSASLRVGDFRFDILVVEGEDRQIYPISGKIEILARNA